MTGAGLQFDAKIWTQDSLGQNNHTHNYKIQDTTGPHRTHSH